MFDNPKKNLKRLEQELLAEEQEAWAERQRRETGKPVNRNEKPSKKTPKAKNRDRVDVRTDDFSEEIRREPNEKSPAGLALLACILMLGILAVLGWWVWVLL